VSSSALVEVFKQRMLRVLKRKPQERKISRKESQTSQTYYMPTICQFS